jgi:fused signal recognition particle receptor
MWFRKNKNKTVPMTTDTNGRLARKLKLLFRRSSVDDEFLAELEETLLTSDVSVAMCEKLIDAVKTTRTPERAKDAMRDEMMKLFEARDGRWEMGGEKPTIILVLGVNGVGKTTTIAKLAHRFQSEGKKVLLVAGDTFRAAAIEQLGVWGERLGCDVVAQKIGADSAAVAFDAVEKAKARGYDIVLIDTAGRMHTKQNLMEELKKMDRVVGKAYPGAPHDRWLVIDATVGQNGLNQAREFHQALGLTGIIVAKLDGTAKGGIVCSIAELGVPIISVGVGESMEDLMPFDPKAFIASVVS